MRILGTRNTIHDSGPCGGACRAIVELQVRVPLLRALATDPTVPATWATVIADLI